MQPLALSDEQRDLVQADGDLFAEACPGAGKTRAIATRFLRLTEAEPRKGIGLLSFTTAAINEVRGRCGDRPDALASPHFVGTFDGFINQFITRPLYVQQYGKTPRFSESWQGIKLASFRLVDMGNLPSIELDWFEIDWLLRATLRDDWIPFKHRRALAQLIATQRDQLQNEATKRCRILMAYGLLSCATSRASAACNLRRRETFQQIGTLLGNRFREIIVDEAQDCGPEELLILNLLRQFGVTVVAVADLDQSIFEFRRAAPEGIRAFADSLGAHLTLNGNYRSSPAVCALNNSLRHGSHQETACGDNAARPTPVQLLEFARLGQVAAAVAALLEVHELPRTEVIFLAHRGSDARSCAGVPSDTSNLSSSRIVGIAQANAILQSNDSTPAERLRATKLVEGTLRVVANVADHDDSTLDDRWLRETAVRLAVRLNPAGSTPKEYAATVRRHVQNIRWPVGITPRPDLGTLLKAPQESAWLASDESEPETFAAATIHSVKGREFAGVVVVLPKNLITDDENRHVLDCWEGRMASELRRVLYVGVSRAQALLILAVHADHRDRVAMLLKGDGVPYEIV